MTILELRNMTKREYALWFSKAKTSDLKEVLDNENLGGGISKFSKANLISVVMDLVDNIVSTLTKLLKPKKIRKPIAEEIKMYREMMKPENQINYYIFSDLNKGDIFTQAGYFMYKNNKSIARKLYLQLVKYYHPDKETGDSEKFKNIQEAWQMAEESYKNQERVGDEWKIEC